MSIKVIESIPQSVKRVSTRDMIRADINEAIEKGVELFEFDGDYNFKTLAGNVREVIKDMKRKYVYGLQSKFRTAEYTEDERTFRGFHCWFKSYYDYKGFWLTVTVCKGEEHPRVFCKIDGKNEFDEKVLKDCREALEKTRHEMRIINGKWEYTERVRER